MYSIIGSGFGLYGYLPAIIKLHKKGVVLPEKYKEKILLRPELKEFDYFLKLMQLILIGFHYYLDMWECKLNLYFFQKEISALISFLEDLHSKLF